MYDSSATGSMAHGLTVFVGVMLCIVTACVGAIMNFAFLPHYPLWSVVVIALDALVVWGLCTQMARSGSSDRS
jgi:hypothetical protein